MNQRKHFKLHIYITDYKKLHSITEFEIHINVWLLANRASTAYTKNRKMAWSTGEPVHSMVEKSTTQSSRSIDHTNITQAVLLFRASRRGSNVDWDHCERNAQMVPAVARALDAAASQHRGDLPRQLTPRADVVDSARRQRCLTALSARVFALLTPRSHRQLCLVAMVAYNSVLQIL